MRAVEQWERIQESLPELWQEARLAFTPEDPSAAAEAAGVLAPLGPGRALDSLRFDVRPSGGPSGVESVRNLMSRLDAKRIWGELGLVDVTVPPEQESGGSELEAQSHMGSERGDAAARELVAAWDAELAKLPPDWSDVLAELELESSDLLPRAALLGAPLNPTRVPGSLAFRFRAGRAGYGTSPTMARRCFERMDAEGIAGRLRILNVLANVENVSTQGPVWRVAGRAV
jgi:hypothetical protein